MSELRILESPEQLDYRKNVIDGVGLVPVVCIDSFNLATEGLKAYRMQAFANLEAVTATFETRKATFYSRSRNGLWVKGELSGNFMVVRSMLTDCDNDSLLLDVAPMGPTCHTGANSCFEIDNQGQWR